MRNHVDPALLAVAFALPAFAAGPESAPDPPAKTLVRWSFEQAGDLQGWQPNGHLQGVTASNGVLSARAVGHDPMFVLTGPLELRASPWQVVEVRLKADRDGECEWFWSNTSQGRFGGFTQEKTTRFNVRGDGQWRTYSVLPFWHPEAKIVRLRLDVHDGTQFALESIRIAELAVPAAATNATFDFAQGAEGWQAIGGSRPIAGGEGLRVGFEAAEDFLLAPAVQVDADADTFVAVRMAVGQGDHGAILFATEKGSGLHRLTFPIIADGLERTYNVDLLRAANWRGRVVALGLRPTDAAGATARVRSLKVGAEPEGAPQLRVVSFAVADALPRAGLPATLTGRLSNTGGETASNVQCQV
ncbi:MAG: hypothetical protein FJ276_29205, partial [Planctomycetes bacterium]|nr:hypothetical protein [Planctomycetota bacterium]